MTKLVLHVQGSAPEPYTVVSERNGSNLSVVCDCAAGAMKQYCKHRFFLFEGNLAEVVGGDVSRVGEIEEFLSGTDVEAALHAIKSSEVEEARAKKQLQKAKKHLASAMQD